MNTKNSVADLSIVLPGEMVDAEEILDSDMDFQARMDEREVEALEFQMMMTDDEGELPY